MYLALLFGIMNLILIFNIIRDKKKFINGVGLYKADIEALKKRNSELTNRVKELEGFIK